MGLYLFPFALGNFFGPLLLGRLFDTVGRRKMISLTYALSGILLAISGWMFYRGMLTATTQSIAWSVVFFVASAASSAYLTVSEIFPLEIRGMAIAIFYACGTLAGGRGRSLYLRPLDPHRIARQPALGILGCGRVDDRRRSGAWKICM